MWREIRNDKGEMNRIRSWKREKKDQTGKGKEWRVLFEPEVRLPVDVTCGRGTRLTSSLGLSIFVDDPYSLKG